MTWFGWASQGLGSSAPCTLGRRGSRARTWSASLPRPRSGPSGRRAARRRSRVRVGGCPRHRGGRRRRAHLHAEPPPCAACRDRARSRQARRLREAAGDRCRAGAPADGGCGPDGPPGDGPVRLPVLPDRSRGARPGPAGETGPVRLIHGTYLQDWLLRPEDDNWRVDEAAGGASRAFADIGSHWCDLAEFVGGHRITRVCGRMITPCRTVSALRVARPSRTATARASAGASGPRTRPSCSSRRTAARSARR